MNIGDLYIDMGGEIKEFEKFKGELGEGYEFTYKKRLAEVDIQFFGFVSGDFNPVHFDEQVASNTSFKGRIAHGILTASFVSAALARLPGLIIILDIYLKYLIPVRIGDIVEVRGRVIEADNHKKRYKVKFISLVGEKRVIEGWANILSW